MESGNISAGRPGSRARTRVRLHLNLRGEITVGLCFSGFWIKHTAAAAKSLQLCPTLCDPTDSSPPGSPLPGILQARTLEWVAISFSSV